MRSERNQEQIKSPRGQTARIQAFWQWFVGNHTKLAFLLSNDGSKQITDMIVPRWDAMTDSLKWEIGPGLKEKHLFAVGLNGSLANLPEAEKVVKEAPVLPNWEFHAGRPPKIWDGRFLMRNKLGQEVSLNSSGWRYILTGFESNRFFDIGIIAEWPSMDLTAKKEAITVALQGILGETTMLQRFDRIEVIASPSPEELKRSSSISDLKRHLDYLDTPLKKP